MTSADELVVRLQVTLDEIEARANAEGHYDPDEGGYYACPATRSEPLGDLPWGEDACTCGLAKRRADTLRLVQAHRDILALHPAGESADADLCKLCDMLGQNEDCMYPCDTVRALARGHGIEDKP